jgi:hypothetical protein
MTLKIFCCKYQENIIIRPKIQNKIQNIRSASNKYPKISPVSIRPYRSQETKRPNLKCGWENEHA